MPGSILRIAGDEADARSRRYALRFAYGRSAAKEYRSRHCVFTKSKGQDPDKEEGVIGTELESSKSTKRPNLCSIKSSFYNLCSLIFVL